MDKKIRTIISIAIIACALVIAIAGFILLPDTIVTQFGSGGNNTTMPKTVGLLIPLAVCVVFSLMFLQGNNEKRDLIVAVLLLAILAFAFFYNLPR